MGEHSFSVSYGKTTSHFLFQRSIATAGIFLETSNRSEVTNDEESLEYLKNLLSRLYADAGVKLGIKKTKHIQDSAPYFFDRVRTQASEFYDIKLDTSQDY